MTFKLLELLLYFEKNCKMRLFRSVRKVSKSTPKIIFIGPPITPNGLLKNWKFWCLLFKKFKQLTFSVFNQSNISTNVYHFWKFGIWGPTIVEITGRRTSYFVSFDTAYRDLITDKGKQQQTRPSPNYSCRVTLPWK